MTTIPEAFAIAVQYQQAGYLPQAEMIGHQIVEADPSHADALHLLGMIAFQSGMHLRAVEYLARAVEVQPANHLFHTHLAEAYLAQNRLAEAVDHLLAALRLNPDPALIQRALAVAIQCHQAGNIHQAEPIYQEVLKADPKNADALHLLGVVAHQVGQHDVAVQYIRQALEQQPTNAAIHSNLSEVYRNMRLFELAAKHGEEALRLQPDFHAALNNLGEAYRGLSRHEDAVACHQAALRVDPNSAQSHYNLANVLWELGRTAEAIEHYQTTLRLQPAAPEVYNNLGLALQSQGRAGEAIAHYHEAMRLKPDLLEVHYNLGLAYTQQGRLDLAEQALRQALALRPDSAEIYNDLGIALKDQGKTEEAIASYKEALRLNPNHVGAHNNLGIAYQDRGEMDQAIKCIREALRLQPTQIIAHSNLLRAMSYDPQVTPQELFEEHLRWAKQHAEAYYPRNATYPNDRSPQRRLRVGYVSPDFREHPIARVAEPILAAHDHEQFEVFCYANVHAPDDVTLRLQRHSDHWRSLVGLKDDEVVQLIRQDGIDILVDLAGHTANNRIRIFAMKPAPIQVAHFGYANTTGLATMDYRITDACSDPPGMTESLHTETLIRMPEVAYCYQPTASPDVNPLPALRTRQVTFASFNYLAKITPEVVALWSRIMKSLPQSRLLLLAGAAGQGTERVRQLFEDQGIGTDRVEFLPRRIRPEFLGFHNRVDICLDPFPYNGGITTCDALWMGIPTVTLEGKTYISRQGISLLTTVGLKEWIAKTPDDYANIAIRWARALPRLQKLRAGLRDRMKASPLTDGPRFTRNLEAAYRTMWEKWLAASGGPASQGRQPPDN